MSSINNRYCENTLIINNKEYKLEKVWRINKNNKTLDAKGSIFPYPSQGPSYVPEIDDIIHVLHVINTYLTAKKRYESYDMPRDCLLCDKKAVSTKRFMYDSLIWEDGLIHYLDVHNVNPSTQFKQFILNGDSVKKILRLVRKSKSLSKSKLRQKKMVLSRVRKENKEYVMIERNQMLILDALMVHGGYAKKYTDVENRLSRYSEHAGFLDFDENLLSKIVVSGKTNRVDEGDDEIFLPMAMEDMFEYEYIFHTHPPTPRPGGRVSDGILYEFPSIGDIYHFIDHHNEGNVIGSLIVTAEGLYNIRKTSDDPGDIRVDEDELYKKYQKTFSKIQRDAIIEYGTKFNIQTFYAKIAQNTDYVDKLNSVLNKFYIRIDYYPRKRDMDGRWIIDTVFLVFRRNKSK